MSFQRNWLVFATLIAAMGCAGCGDDDMTMGDGGTDAMMDGGFDDGDLPDGDRPDGEVPRSDLFEPPTITTCDPAAMPASGCEVTAGGANMLIVGDVLTPGEVFRGGQVLVDGSGNIMCVGCDCPAGDATVIACQAVISPGLINGHDHITFDNTRPYGASGQETDERYEHRHDWRRGLDDHRRLNSMGGRSRTEEMQWTELRQLMAGGTSVFGSGGPEGLLRNLDSGSRQEGLGQPEGEYQTFPLGDSDGRKLTDGCGYDFRDDTTASDVMMEDAYVPHVAEGIDEASRNEFLCMREGERDVVQPASAFIHGVGLLAPDIAEMAVEQVELVWSPRTNITLYGDTARVSEYARLGVPIALGTDWIPTGSMNMLRELRCADEFNERNLNGFFPDEQIWLMATQNAARAFNMDDATGAIQVGLTADIAIFAKSNGREDHRAVLAADPNDVLLVMRGGEVLFGDSATVGALVDGCDDMGDVCGANKSVCLAEIGTTFSALTGENSDSYELFFCGEPDSEPSCLPARNVMAGGSLPDAMVNGSNYYAGMSEPDDMDGDGIRDMDDNCPTIFNPIRPLDNGAQADFDDDGEGDACDVCPVGGDDPATCVMVDPNDRDGDGVPNDEDNCPLDPNGDQADMDDDDKGDACDVCPMDSNPGTAGCPSSVYAVRRGEVPDRTTVSMEGLVVTAITRDGYYAQMDADHPMYEGVEESGIFIHIDAEPTGVSLGDRFDVVSGTTEDYFGEHRLNDVTVTRTAGGDVPVPLVVTPAEIATGGARQEELECVLLRVENVSVSNVNPDAPDNFGEFEVDGLRVDDRMFAVEPAPGAGEEFRSITGPLAFSFSNSKLLPRDSADVRFASLRISPTAGRVRTEGEIMLSIVLPEDAPAGGAEVALEITPAGILSGPASITIPAGESTGMVTLTSSTSVGTVTITASYDGESAESIIEVAEPVGGGLIISEYVEGPGGGTKALELFSGDADIDLGACELRLYINGSETPRSLMLSGTLSAGDTRTYCNDTAAITAFGGSCDEEAGFINHNGNDAYALVCDGMVMDSFGQVGEDADFTADGLSAKDYVLRRSCTSAEGDMVIDDAVSFSDWEGEACTSGSCDLSTFGSRGC